MAAEVHSGGVPAAGALLPLTGWRGQRRSGAEWSGVERSGAEWSGVERSGAEWSGVERSGAEWSGRSGRSGRSGAERSGRSGVERSGAEWSGVERSGAEWSGVERSGAEPSRAQSLFPSQPTRAKQPHGHMGGRRAPTGGGTRWRLSARRRACWGSQQTCRQSALTLSPIYSPSLASALALP